MAARLAGFADNRVQQAVAASAGAATAFSIPESKTYLSLVADNFYKQVLRGILPEERLDKWIGGKRPARQFATQMFFFLTEADPKAKPIVRDGAVFTAVYRALVGQTEAANRIQWPARVSPEFPWAEQGVIKVAEAAEPGGKLSLVHQRSGVRIPAL